MPDIRESILQSALEAAAGITAIDLNELFTADVSGWSPNLNVHSLDDLQAVFSEREGTFSNTELVLNAVDVVGDKAIAEWRLATDHTGPLVLDDDDSNSAALEPTGRRLVLAGAFFAEFRGSRICAFRNYFDDAALLEQLLFVT